MCSRIGSLLVLVTLALVAACASGNQIATVEGLSAPVGEEGGDEVQLLYEGKGPIEITPPSGGRNNSASPSADQDGGNVSSLGGEAQGKAIGEEPGQVNSFAPSERIAGNDQVESVEWLTYQDQAFPFSINFPQTYSILTDDFASQDQNPALVHQVRFQDQALTISDTASFEIPKFNIEIFELGAQTLVEFLDSNTSADGREVYTQAGLSGWRVYFNRLSAPNEFYYFSHDGYVYRLTPQGKYGEEMLHSFEIKS